MITTLLKYLLVDHCINIMFRSWETVMSTIDPTKIKFILGKRYDIETSVNGYESNWKVIYRQFIDATVTEVYAEMITVECKHVVQDMSFPAGSEDDYERIVRNMGKILGIDTKILHYDIRHGVMSVYIAYYRPIRTTLSIHDVMRYSDRP